MLITKKKFLCLVCNGTICPLIFFFFFYCAFNKLQNALHSNNTNKNMFW